MKRCPKCGRFGVEYDPYSGKERCLWKECLWVNANRINLDKKKFSANYDKFRKTIKIKKGIAV